MLEIIALMLGSAGLAFGISALILDLRLVEAYKKQLEELLNEYNNLVDVSNKTAADLVDASEELKKKRSILRDIDRILEDVTLTRTQKCEKINELFISNFSQLR